MSILFSIIGLILIILPVTDASIKAVGIGLLMTVSGAWFVPNAARQVVQEINKTQQEKDNAS